MNYDFFIDESCHLEHDGLPVMCIGYTKVPRLAYQELASKIIALKATHKTMGELKWNKFSNSRLPLYKALVDLFFSSPLEFRCVLAKYKDRLNHSDFNSGSHDNYYYKLVYYLLRPNNATEPGYRVFLDMKDTRGREKLKKIKDVFHNHHAGLSPFTHFQHLQSLDNVFFQITDIIIGAVTYKARYAMGQQLAHHGKLEFIAYLEKKSGFSINEGTVPWESKFNIFDHQPKRH